jgi:hypothetical protein
MGKSERNNGEKYVEQAGSYTIGFIGVLFFLLLLAGHNEALFWDGSDMEIHNGETQVMGAFSGVTMQSVFGEKNPSELTLADSLNLEQFLNRSDIEEFILEYRQKPVISGEDVKIGESWSAQGYMINF